MQTQPQYSLPHGRRRVMTPLTHDQNKNTNTHIYQETYMTLTCMNITATAIF